MNNEYNLIIKISNSTELQQISITIDFLSIYNQINLFYNTVLSDGEICNEFRDRTTFWLGSIYSIENIDEDINSEILDKIWCDFCEWLNIYDNKKT